MGIAVTLLIVLHLIDGRTVAINPAQVTRLSETREDEEQLAAGVNCVIYLTDGRYVSVAEPCDTVQSIMEGAKHGHE